ncbi:hypothetical protein B0T20DRAFT_343025 [Sordaria brevicollis]|uniref:Uncharacterized protein n=1 Tax=Sordaria brevicollis TaxID=83679 RepID=A0AAE0PMZ6_SORBR|nr:hypothetical protein B0T20DRAFT_343025 [Sordaria brevicollis]
MSGIINKIKEAVHSDNSAHHGAPEGTAGPHNSRVANAADPRVDSDMDGSHRKVAGHGEHGSHTYGTGHPEAYTLGGNATGSNPTGTHATTHSGTHNTYGSSGTHGTSEGAYGPHSSRAANALDPRVDSDRDGSRTAGTGTGAGYNTHSTGNTFGSSGTHGTSEGAYGPHSSRAANALDPRGAYGPHSSRAANALDPRVDSDRDGSRTAGNTTGTHTGTHNAGTFGTIGTHDRQNHPFSSSNTHGAGSGHTGVTGTHGAPTGTHGPHDSRAANALDPRVDSDRDGRGALGRSSGPGPAPNTAGPHSSDMANKLDPRVDSDLDGSKTVGGNKTYNQQTHTSNLAHKDPTDAAQVPPSVLRKSIGEPVIEHEDHGHHRERRNSIKTHQETYSGI